MATSVRDEMIRLLDTLSRVELDELPVRVSQLDRAGTVVEYNEQPCPPAPVRGARARLLSGIAPCAAVRDFQGRFDEGLAQGELEATFGYRFRFPDDRGKDVTITRSYRQPSGRVWVIAERP